jgi:hypothetical protein
MMRAFFSLYALAVASTAFSQNQTDTVSPIYPSYSLPFEVVIETEDFSLPNGLHSYVAGVYDDQWLLLAGRTNGLHGFNDGNDNFPPQEQNTVVYVVDIKNKTVSSKSLSDPTSGLTQEKIDSLSVTSPQFYQWENNLFMCGGYGVDTSSGEFSTKTSFTVIDIPGLIRWVKDTTSTETAIQYIRQISDPFFQVTGGSMYRVDKERSLLIFGQNFQGYYVPESNGQYTEQVRVFKIEYEDTDLKVKLYEPEEPNPNFRRRDLNVVPVIDGYPFKDNFKFVALSGVFTEDGGAWTVPVEISLHGKATMADPDDPHTFKQGMNNYTSATVEIFDERHGDMYIVLFGGISFGYFDNGVFTTDSELPFINQVTTIQIDKHGKFKQFIMNGQYPEILSTGSNPGNPLLFGAGANFFPSDEVSSYKNTVLKMHKIGKKPVLVGYIVGGIQSTLPNTNTTSDSAASPYIFKVTLVPND